MKFGILKERVHQIEELFSPDELLRLKQLYKDATIKVESSDIRILPMNNIKNWESKL
jgi:acyl-CoA-binding protein